MVIDHDRLEVDKITSHLNHQIVSPIAGLRNSIRFLAEELEGNGSAELGHVASSTIAARLQASAGDLLTLARSIQGLRSEATSQKIVAMVTVSTVIETEFLPVLEATQSELKSIRDDDPGFLLLTRERRRDFDLVMRQANQCLRMLRNVWISSTKIDLRPLSINIDRVIELAFLNARSSAMEDSIKFSETVKLNYKNGFESSSIADYDKLSEVFQNLFENTFRYVFGEKIGEIDVFVSNRHYDELGIFNFNGVPKTSENYILFRYSDGGALLPEEEWDKVFHRGIRGSNAPKADDTGVGYGLYYCRKVMRAHGGDIIYRVNKEFPQQGAFLLFVGMYYRAAELKRAQYIVEEYFK